MTKGELAVRNGFSRDGPRGCAPAGAGLSSQGSFFVRPAASVR